MTQTFERSSVIPNASSRLVDIRTRVTGNGKGLIDSENQVHLEWANPTTIGQQVDRLIKQTDDSMHGVFVREEDAQKLAKDMQALLKAKNTVSAIQVFGFLADVSQSDRFYAANTVAWMMVEPDKRDQLAHIRTRLAAELGHRQSKRALMTLNRVNLGA
ncbi:MAG: hypothetical protein WC851_04295 [Candidatus Shapirobacteria bacterium]|jgi:hypothetical protein